MNARRFALLAALALFISFLSANVIANSWFRGWRLDLTENQLYSLSPGTQRTLDDLSEPVELKLYYSRDAGAESPQLRAYAARVREMLQTFAARSHGRVRFAEVDVEAFAESENEAEETGIEPFRLTEGGDPVYFGLAGANAIDDQRVIPMFAQEREPFLEYEITRLIYELENPNRVRVGLITSLPIDPGAANDPAMAMMRQSAFATEMGRFFEVVKLTPGFIEIPDVDVLAIIHPGQLTPQQSYAIDQFILRHGRAFIAVDPASFMAQEQGATSFDPFNPVAPAPTASTLEPLFAQWGVALAPGVVLDQQGALPVQAQDPQSGQPVQVRQPLFFAIPAVEEQLDREDMVTASLRRGLNFGLSGALTWSEREGVEVRPLARTSGRTMRMAAADALAQPTPFDILRMWPQGGGRVETVALRLSGNITTAYPDGRPADLPPAAAEGDAAAIAPPPPPAASEHLTSSATPAEIVIIADVDFLSDDFYFDPNSGASVADNAALALNAIDVLGGSDALVSLRSRAQSLRRMTLVDDMEADAQRRIQRRAEELQREQQETEARLAELQARGRGSGFFVGDLGAELTPDENLEIERFMARAREVRSELRNVRRDVRGEIDRLQALVLFINIWLAPLLVAGAGLVLFWRRQRRGSAGR